MSSSASIQSRMASAISSVMLGSFIRIALAVVPVESILNSALTLILPDSSETPYLKAVLPWSSAGGGATRLNLPWKRGPSAAPTETLWNCPSLS